MNTELKDHAIPGDTAGTAAKEFAELFPPIESTATLLRCKATGVLYPNQPPFTDRSDMLEPYVPATTAPTTPTEPAPVIAAPVIAAPGIAAPVVEALQAPVDNYTPPVGLAARALGAFGIGGGSTTVPNIDL